MEFNIQEWNGLSSTSLSDAMAGCQTMDAAIKPLDKRMTVTGPAYTIQIVKNDCSVVFKALREAPEGAVLVIAAHGTTDAAFLGEIVVTIARKQGLVVGCLFTLASSCPRRVESAPRVTP